MKKVIAIVFPLLLLLHLLLGIWWLALCWGIAWGLMWLFTTSAKPVVRIRKSNFLLIPLVVIGPVLAAIVFKTLFFGIYVIPSGSMEKTIVPGDMVWVNNLSYGPRLPYSPYEISWINGLVWLLAGKDADVQEKWWPYHRLKGYSSPKRGDITVFNHPEHNTVFIKRIVALPGDTLQIVDGSIRINNKQQAPPQKSLYYSKALFKNKELGGQILDSLQIKMYPKDNKSERILFSGSLHPSQLQALQKHPQVLEAGIDPCRPDTAWTVYPHSEHYKWSIDNYGPYRLPYKGMQVALSPENIRLYGRLMQIEANDLSEIEADSSGSFTFNKDYYFIMGDHFHDSEDSRYFGPVREELLIGKVSFLLYSKATKAKVFPKILQGLK